MAASSLSVEIQQWNWELGILTAVTDSKEMTESQTSLG
jgi:hypothetical protein